MRNIRLEIEYDGTNYCGWQTQKRVSKPNIQETIEKSLQKILQEKIKIIASGRTDAGVHAQGQIANFKTNSSMPLWKLSKALNAVLPEDIVTTKLDEVGLDFHSRFAAKSKVYRYTILNRKHPTAILKDRVYFYPYPLDVRLMQKESKILLGRHDFKSFQASGSRERNTVRRIKKLKITKSKDLIFVDIEADGFLYNMVRNIVGTLIEIGRGRFRGVSLKKILLSKDRRLAGPTVPARGLCLVEVKY